MIGRDWRMVRSCSLVGSRGNRVDWLTNIGDISNITIVVVSSVSNILGTTIRKSNRVGASDCSISVRGFSSTKLSLGIVISNSISVGVWLRFFLVDRSSSMISGSMDHRGSISRGMDNRGPISRSMDNRGLVGRGNDNRSLVDRSMDDRSSVGRGVNNRGPIGRSMDNRGLVGRGMDNRGPVGRGMDNWGPVGRGMDNWGPVGRGMDNGGSVCWGMDYRGPVSWGSVVDRGSMVGWGRSIGSLHR